MTHTEGVGANGTEFAPMMTLDEVREWLGPGPVFFVPQSLGTKKPMMKWKDATMEDTRRSTWIAMCTNNNAAVRLGQHSGDPESGYLCAIDFDDEEAFMEFIAVNPGLATTARWKGRRGCQIGVRILGQYPESCSARSKTEFLEPTEDGKPPLGRPLYEWRADGNLSTVRGTHPSGCEYQVLVPNRPVQIRFEDIKWPEGWPVPGAVNPLDALQERFGVPWVFNKFGQATLHSRFFAALFVHDNRILFDDGPGVFYLYRGDRGLWQQQSRESVSGLVNATVERVVMECIKADPDDGRLPSLIPRITARFLGEVVDLIRLMTVETGAFARLDAVVHTLNVMVDLRVRPYGVHPFGPEWRSRNQCRVSYEAGARCPKWKAFLDHALPDKDDQRMLQHWGGLALMQRNRCQVFLLLTGTGGGGKGTVASLIRRLVGDENCGELRTDHMAGRFEAGVLMAKTLLVGADVAPDFLQTDGASRLKAWTGGDHITAEFKNRNQIGSVTGEWNALITANSRLRVRVEGDLGAWSRRLLLLEFNQPKPATVIPNYHDVLLAEEGSGILNWFLEGAELLAQEIANGKPFPRTAAQETRVADLLSESDSVRYFVSNHVRRSSMSADSVTSEDLFTAYLQMCGAKDWQSEPQRRFQIRAAELMLEIHQVVRTEHLARENGYDSGKRGYRHVMLVGLDDASGVGEDAF